VQDLQLELFIILSTGNSVGIGSNEKVAKGLSYFLCVEIGRFF
jgi:hypothetical protein